MKYIKLMDAPHPVLTAIPLPFNPAKLRGISEKLIVSHHDHNYAGAVKNLNAVRAELAALPADAPAWRVGGLRAHELYYGNSITLHEHYFANLGGDGRAHGAVARAITASWGLYAHWESAFRGAAGSLGGGSGWVVLDLHLPTGELRIGASSEHSKTLAAGLPLLVLDMYEHAYQMDYGAAADQYIAAFFDNLNWDEVNRRHERARKTLATYDRETRNEPAAADVPPPVLVGDKRRPSARRIPVPAMTGNAMTVVGENNTPEKNHGLTGSGHVAGK